MLIHSTHAQTHKYHVPESSSQPDQPLCLVPISDSLLSSFLHLTQVKPNHYDQVGPENIYSLSISARLCQKHADN